MILRGGAWGERVAARVRGRGGVPVIYPLIEVVYAHSAELRAAVKRWSEGDYDWVILTSANAVNAMAAVAGSGDGSGSSGSSGSRPRSRVAVIGPGTAQAARVAGIDFDLIPEHDFSTEGLIAALAAEPSVSASDPVAPKRQRILLPLSNLSDERLQSWLSAVGHRVDRVTAYQTERIEQDARSRTAFSAALAGSDLVLVTSGSAARALALNLDEIDAAKLRNAVLSNAARPDAARLSPALPTIAAIGAPTAAALLDAGYPAQLVAATQTIDGLLDAMAARLHEPNDNY